MKFLTSRIVPGLLLATPFLAGCGQSEPPEFQLNMQKIVEAQIDPAYQQQIADVLGAMFGTPDEPFVMAETGLSPRKVKMAAGAVWTEQDGTGHGLYRRHCVHCHGISGDGMGPTAMFLNPYPRDYRPGVYKFKSTYNPAAPTDADLHRVLMNGVPGTAMPSFALLPPAEVDALIEYVKYLSMRGQMETALINYVMDELGEEDGELIPLDPSSDAEQKDLIVSELLPEIVAGWDEAEDNVIQPDIEVAPPADRSEEELLASVEKGRALFYGTRANCIKCHGPTGLGDGQQDDHDIWNKALANFETAKKNLVDTIAALNDELREAEDAEERDEIKADIVARKAELADREMMSDHLFSPRNAIPRNLRQGTYRGGNRPLDIFRKVYTGIAGTPMPGGGPATPGAKGTLSEEEMWQIVDYVRSLPYEPASQPRTVKSNLEAVVN